MGRPVSPDEGTGTKQKAKARESTGMQIARTIDSCRKQLEMHRRAGRRIGLVATMGAFHDGHLSLMHAARHECDIVVASLFVNPTQFQPGEDLESYPTDPNRDHELAEKYGVDLLFAPDTFEMYGDGSRATVNVSELSEKLCGSPERRGPGHFNGVTTVVSKLFNIVQPDLAYFGQKDAQQVAVIQKMVDDLNFPVDIRVLPTVREKDGLAMSSRNVYLTEDERERATCINRSLEVAEELIESGERDAKVVVKAALAELERADIEPEYLELVDSKDLTELDELDGDVLIAVAAQVGKARLIDNKLVNVPVRGKTGSTADERHREVTTTGAAK